MKIRIEEFDLFNVMLSNGEIKVEWSKEETRSIKRIIEEVLLPYVNYDKLYILECKNRYGIMEAMIYAGITYKNVKVDNAYFHQNGNIVLATYQGENIIIIDREGTDL